MAITATELRTEVVRFARLLEPELMTGEQAARVVVELASVEKAAATARMFAAVRVAQTDAWRGQGHASAASWLAAQTGISVGRAAAQLRTAREASKLPKTKAAMEDGKLSPDQADAVTGAAAADPGAEDELLKSAAEDTSAELRRKADRARAAATDAAERDRRVRRVRRERSVRYRNDAEGAFCLNLRGPGVDGAAIVELLRPFEEAAFQASRAAGRAGGPRETHDNRTYDAFLALLASVQAEGDGGAGAGAGTGGSQGEGADASAGRAGRGRSPRRGGDGEASGAPSPAQDRRSTASTGSTAPTGSGLGPAGPALRPRGGANTKVIVRIDHTALRRGHTIAGETCDIAGLGPLSVAAVAELLRDGDPFIAAVVTDGTDIRSVVHLGRTLTAHQRTALEALTLRCTNIACNKTIGLQIDHRTPWVQEQRTVLDEQDPLCPHCHCQKTHHGWHLEPGTGPRRFLPPTSPGAGPPGRGDTRPPPPKVEQPTLC